MPSERGVFPRSASPRHAPCGGAIRLVVGAAKRIFEPLAVIAAPAIAFFALRLRAMAPVGLPDPSMHTTFLLQPRDIFLRYQAAFTPTARLREGARVGFLVPARLSDVLFGAVPGFFTTRYFFALAATVPLYVFFKRVHGTGAGALAIAVVLTSPVVLTAWGTDYPDSAVVAYASGACGCLALSFLSEGRRWLIAGVALLTMAVWAHGMGAIVATTVVVSYLVVRVLRARADLVVDVSWMAATALVTTVSLVLGSSLLLGQANFITPTWQAYRYLSRPGQILQWHSTSWRWAPYVTYVLVPPAVLLALLVSFGARVKALSSSTTFLLLSFVVQVVVFFYEQFIGHLQTLEQHYFSSTLWATLCITLVLVVIELSGSRSRTGWRAWLGFVVVVVVPFAYELDPHVPAFGWLPYGAVAAASLVMSAAAAVTLRALPNSWFKEATIGGLLVLFVGAALILTVAPMPRHRLLAHTVADQPPTYAKAFGGSSADALDMYRISARLGAFVGPATYRGEQLMMWSPLSETGPLIEPLGIYHSGFDLLDASPPSLTNAAQVQLAQRRPAEILVMSLRWNSFRGVLAALHAYRPKLVRSGELAAGRDRVYVWLVDLRKYLK